MGEDSPDGIQCQERRDGVDPHVTSGTDGSVDRDLHDPGVVVSDLFRGVGAFGGRP